LAGPKDLIGHIWSGGWGADSPMVNFKGEVGVALECMVKFRMYLFGQSNIDQNDGEEANLHAEEEVGKNREQERNQRQRTSDICQHTLDQHMCGVQPCYVTGQILQNDLS
jgi:hypothetical protein